eukprot:g10988.t1
MSEVHIPTINIEPLLEGSRGSYSAKDRDTTAISLMRACATHGLFFVTGHGITATQRRVAFDNARRFFSLPESAKTKVPARKGGFTRGYIGFGGESGSHLLECKEAFSFGFPWPDDQPPTNALQGPNIWPDRDSLAEDWRDSMVSLFRLMVSVNEAVARGLSLCPDLGLQGLPSLCQGGDTISLMRLFHYFPYGNDDGGGGNGKGDGDGGASRRERESGAGKIGSSPHTDWGLSTSILQDGAGGLQFLDQKARRWIDVPCAHEDALVFNCGDYLSLLSNGRLKSPVHQVVTTGVERTSFVFFYYPNFDAKLPTLAAPTNTDALDNSNPGTQNSTGSATSASALPSPPASAVEARVLVSEGNRAEAVAAVSGAEGAPSTAASTRGIGPYNTLLDLKREDAGDGSDGSGGGSAKADADDESFGKYLARKWGAVFRE